MGQGSIGKGIRDVVCKEVGQGYGGSKEPIGRGHVRVGNILMFVKNGRCNAQRPRGFYPQFPGTVVFKRSAKEPTFAIVFCKNATFLGLVVDEGFHANGYEGR